MTALEFLKEIEFAADGYCEICKLLNRHAEDCQLGQAIVLLEQAVEPGELRETLAELAHEQWSGWMVYLFSKCDEDTNDGTVIIPQWAAERWAKQARMLYSGLSEQEQESDRAEADKFLAVFQPLIDEQAAEKAELDALRAFPGVVGEWGEETFTKATHDSICTHMAREVKELKEAQPDDIPHEAADVLLMLLHIAHRCGFDLHAEAEAKHKINTGREWGEPDAEGVVEHVRPEQKGELT